jgi:hypothetical protein
MTCAEAVAWYTRAYCERTVARRLALPKPGTLAEALTAMENAEPHECRVDPGAFVSMWTTGRSQRRPK